MWLDILRIWSRCKTKSYEICGKRCHLLWHSPILGSRGQMWEIGTVEIVEVSVEDILWYLKITLQTMLYTFCRCVELQSHWFSDASNQKNQSKCIGRSLRLVFFWQKSGPKAENGEWWASAAHHRWGQNHPSLEGAARKFAENPPWTNMEQHIWGCVSLFHFFPFIFSIIFIYNRTST